MNIVIFSEDYLPAIGGIASHVQNLALALSSRGNQVQIITMRRLAPGRNLTVWKCRELLRDGIPVLEIPVLYSPRNCLLSFQQKYRFASIVSRWIIKTRASVLHWHSITFDPYVVRYAKENSAMVFTNHSSQFLEGIYSLEEERRKELFSFYDFAHRVIAPS